MGLKQLQLTSIHLKAFRCFDQITIDLNSPIVLICGSNGTGKTSLLEALYYACYLRSFRTHLSRDLISLGKESFFIKLIVQDSSPESLIDHTINIGFAGNKRRVTVDNQAIVSYKDLLSHYRIVSLTEADLKLIQDGPENRRAFIDQALILDNASSIGLMREYRIILENRNALLQNNVVDKDTYDIWTQKLWECTAELQALRKLLLQKFEATINTMLAHYVDPNMSVSLHYQAKKENNASFEGFLQSNKDLMRSEMYFKRSCFGAHLDDFNIVLEGKKTRVYASRGQQKMIVLLIKIAQIKQLIQNKGPVIFLLDDFMTDFDNDRGQTLLSALLELDCQLIFTSPQRNSALESALTAFQLDYKIISM